jgi:hypothetical protein
VSYRYEDGAGWDDRVHDLLLRADKLIYTQGDARRALALIEEAQAILEDHLEIEKEEKP